MKDQMVRDSTTPPYYLKVGGRFAGVGGAGSVGSLSLAGRLVKRWSAGRTVGPSMGPSGRAWLWPEVFGVGSTLQKLAHCPSV